MPDFEFKLSPLAAPATAPKSAPPASVNPRRKPGPKPKTPLPSNNILLVDNDISGEGDLKSQMTLKELKFLEFHLVEGMNIDKSMIAAGYQQLTSQGRNYKARKIVQKYESQAGDHRKIFRAVGAGEVAVAQGLLEIAKGPYPADVRRKAWADIASCLGLKSEQVESFQGMSINIRGMTPAEQGIVIEADGQPSKPALPPPFKPSQVTK